MKRELFLEAKFNENRILSTAEDWELWLRLISRVPLLRCNEVTFEIRNHTGRSLFNIPPNRIAERDTLLYKTLIEDPFFVDKFGSRLGRFRADLHTFSALVFSLSPIGKQDAMSHLIKALYSSPSVVTSRRFWASIKHVITNRV